MEEERGKKGRRPMSCSRDWSRIYLKMQTLVTDALNLENNLLVWLELGEEGGRLW